MTDVTTRTGTSPGAGEVSGVSIVAVQVPPGPSPQEYRVEIAPGSLIRLGEACETHAPAHRYAIIADSRVAELYGPAARQALAGTGAKAELFTFPAGEWNKSADEWSALSGAMLRAGFGRDSTVIALGGGVAGDLAGFVAATYMRGVPLIQVPTSLLAMVDSSVGGKTGIDTEAGKNLIGAFHPPRHVLIDPLLLDTLPPHQVTAGLAEAVKTAAIADPELFGWLEEHAGLLTEGDAAARAELIARSVAIKAAIVARDPREAGERAILNFGHTVGHALELLFGFSLLHGEAVAAGMRVEGRLGEGLGVTEPGTATRLEALLDRCGLEARPEEERRPEEIWRVASRDKKAWGGAVRCVLLQRIGSVAQAADGGWAHPLAPETAVEAIGAALRPGSGSPD